MNTHTAKKANQAKKVTVTVLEKSVSDGWLRCDRCDFGYGYGFLSRGDQCGDMSWVPLERLPRDWLAQGDTYTDVLECKGRVWPARWMTQRSDRAIAEERMRLLLMAPALVAQLHGVVRR